MGQSPTPKELGFITLIRWKVENLILNFHRLFNSSIERGISNTSMVKYQLILFHEVTFLFFLIVDKSGIWYLICFRNRIMYLYENLSLSLIQAFWTWCIHVSLILPESWLLVK